MKLNTRKKDKTDNREETELLELKNETNLNPHPNLNANAANSLINYDEGSHQIRLKSDWPSSLRPIITKVLEKVLLKRIEIIIEREGVILNHQVGFREKHTTIE